MVGVPVADLAISRFVIASENASVIRILQAFKATTSLVLVGYSRAVMVLGAFGRVAGI